MPEDFVDSANTLMDYTRYGMGHGCAGYTFTVWQENSCVGLILLGEALPWPTDPPEMRKEPFYRLMGFVLDTDYRGKGLGGAVLEEVIRRVYADFGVRPIALGCHRENHRAAAFYLRHGFQKTDVMEKNDVYYLRYPSGREHHAL